LETKLNMIQGSTLGFTMLIIMCSQFSMLNIYHPCGCHFKDRNIMWQFACFVLWSHFNPPKSWGPIITLLASLESFRQRVMHACHFIIFKLMKQELLNLEWCFYWELICNYKILFSTNQFPIHCISPSTCHVPSLTLTLGPMAFQFMLGVIKSAVHISSHHL
jgi:hypothetical protein